MNNLEQNKDNNSNNVTNSLSRTMVPIQEQKVETGEGTGIRMGTETTYQEIVSLPRLIELFGRELFEKTKDLSGEKSGNRETKRTCQIRAKNDFEAIQCWLEEYKNRPSTYRTYQKEVERLLLWSVYQHEKSLSSLDRKDFETYFDFLSNPQPRKIWCSS